MRPDYPQRQQDRPRGHDEQPPGQSGRQDERGQRGPGGLSYGGYGTSGDHGYDARGEYGESQTGRRLPYGVYGPEQDRAAGGYTGYGTYGAGGAGNEERARIPRRGPKGYVRSDERINEDIHQRLMEAEDVDAGNVSIEVQGGKVILEGTVPERRMKHAIEDLVDECPGVQDIDNRIRVCGR